MFKRIISTIIGAGLGTVALAQEPVVIGGCQLSLPSGWAEIKKTEDCRVFQSPDGHQRVTVSIMRFDAEVSFDDFKKLSQHRIEAEKKELGEGFVQPDEPFEDAGTYGIFFSGGEKKTGRVFSGYLSMAKKELITIYVEGVGVAPKDHLESFKVIVKGLKRN